MKSIAVEENEVRVLAYADCTCFSMIVSSPWLLSLFCTETIHQQSTCYVFVLFFKLREMDGEQTSAIPNDAH